MMKRKGHVSGLAVIASPPLLAIAGLIEQSQNVAAAVYPSYTHTVSLNARLRHYSPMVGSGSNGSSFLWMKEKMGIGQCSGAFLRAPGANAPHTTASGTAAMPGAWPSRSIVAASTVTGFDPGMRYRWVYE